MPSYSLLQGKKIVLLLCFLAGAWLAPSLMTQDKQDPETVLVEPNESPNENRKSQLQRKFISIQLGLSIDEVKAELRTPKDPADASESYYYFLYDSTSPEIEIGGTYRETLLEVQGSGFVQRGLFHFFQTEDSSEPKLVAITIFLNPKWSSYEQFLQKFSQEYGMPNSLNPQRSIWENADTIITLEKQLRYKILDKQYFEAVQQRDQENFDLNKLSYNQFLEIF